MGSRIISCVVGLVLCVAGYGLIAPAGPVGVHMAALDLGPLAAQRTTLGALLTALGAVFAVAAFLPGVSKPKRQPKISPPVATHDAQPFGAVVSTLAPTVETVTATPILAVAGAPALAAQPEPFPAEPILGAETAVAPQPLLAAPPAPEFAAPEFAAPQFLAPELVAFEQEAAPQGVEEAATAALDAAMIEDAVIVEPAAIMVETPPPPPAYKAPMETFELVRTRLHQFVRAESWAEAGETARRLPALASNDREHLLAAQDVGDMARAHGRLDDAAEAYDQALAYARMMHSASPTDPGRATLLADALVNAGDMAQEHGYLDSAIVSYEEAVALRREAAVASPDSHALRVLSVTLERLADAREDRGHRMRALGLYKESHQIALQLASLNPARYCSDLAITEQRLSELQARIDA